MSEALQKMIEQANHKDNASRRKVFAKNANDRQHHENLCVCVEIYVDAFRKDPGGNSTREAFREMQAAMGLSRRKLS